MANDLLPRLVGERMYSVTFVRNGYLQLRLRFDRGPGAGPPVALTSAVWPTGEESFEYL